jgi:hypothetical protein
MTETDTDIYYVGDEDEYSEIPYSDWDAFTPLVDPVDEVYANNAIRHDFKCDRCGLFCESHSNEITIWHCPRCSRYSTVNKPPEFVPLRKVIRSCPSISRVWHGHPDMSTGKWITGRKQLKEELHVASEEVSERLNLEHRFVMADMSDHKTLGITDEGLDSTHDAHVKMGFKSSKGQFVFPMSSKPSGAKSTPKVE